MKTQHLKPIHDLNTPTQSSTKRNVRVYRLQPAQAAPAPALRLDSDPLAPAKTLRPQPALQPLHPTEWPTPAASQSILKVGLDIDFQRLTSTIQWDHLQPKPARDFKSPAEFEPLREQILQAKTQIDPLTVELEARVAHEKIPKGFGPGVAAFQRAEQELGAPVTPRSKVRGATRPCG